MILSKKARELKISSTMAATLKARELEAKGNHIIMASVGEPQNDVTLSIKDALIKKIQSGPSRYGSSQGILPFRKNLADWFKRYYNTDYSADQISITPGSKYGLFTVLQILAEEGQEVLIPTPYWVSYEALTELSGAKPVIIRTPNTGPFAYKLSASQLEESINEKTRILILNSPNNPTGISYSLDELKSLYEVLKNYPKIDIMCDDIYNLLYHPSFRAPHFLDFCDEEFKKRLIIVHGAAKAYSMTGYRIGWIAARSEYTEKFTQFLSHTLTCVPDFIQEATNHAIVYNDLEVEQFRRFFAERFERISKEISPSKKIHLAKSNGAFYAWIKVLDHSKTSSEIADELLSKHGLATVAGIAFGEEYHIRVSLTVSEKDFLKTIEILKNYFS